MTEMYSMQSPATGHLAFRFSLGREKRGYGRRPEQRNQAPAGELKSQAARELRGKLHVAIHYIRSRRDKDKLTLVQASLADPRAKRDLIDRPLLNMIDHDDRH